MSKPKPATVRVAMVNHNAVEIAKSADIVWRDILHTYLTGEGFSGQGHKLTPLKDDPSAPMGGYRMMLSDASGKVVDDRIVRITENDPANRRLSLCADYLSPDANGLIVNASYQAAPTPTGARYLLDAYSMLNLPLESGDTQASVAAKVAKMQAQAGDYLVKALDGLRKRLEALPAA